VLLLGLYHDLVASAHDSINTGVTVPHRGHSLKFHILDRLLYLQSTFLSSIIQANAVQ
jgi:hypothetical protein